LPLSAIARARPRNPPLCAASKAHAVETEHCAGQSLLAARRLRHSLPRSGRRKRSARQPGRGGWPNISRAWTSSFSTNGPEIASGTESLLTLRWRGMDSKIQFRDASPPPSAWAPSFDVGSLVTPYVRLMGPSNLLETPGLGELRAGSCILFSKASRQRAVSRRWSCSASGRSINRAGYCGNDHCTPSARDRPRVARIHELVASTSSLPHLRARKF
jgi:hypothetical protein